MLGDILLVIPGILCMSSPAWTQENMIWDGLYMLTHKKSVYMSVYLYWSLGRSDYWLMKTPKICSVCRYFHCTFPFHILGVACKLPSTLHCIVLKTVVKSRFFVVSFLPLFAVLPSWASIHSHDMKGCVWSGAQRHSHNLLDAAKKEFTSSKKHYKYCIFRELQPA